MLADQFDFFADLSPVRKIQFPGAKVVVLERGDFHDDRRESNPEVMNGAETDRENPDCWRVIDDFEETDWRFRGVVRRTNGEHLLQPGLGFFVKSGDLLSD